MNDSILLQQGLNRTVDSLCDVIRTLYLEDETPWIVGYSGGKDSTATLQLVWLALSALPREQRMKTVHIISTDTLVENPIVAQWVSSSLGVMKKAALEQEMPIEPHRLTPRVEDSFWVNLIGKGYPAPRHKFRWCTERLKIQPSNRFILEVVRKNREAILVLGTRKSESSKRAHTMNRLERKRLRDMLSPNASLPGSLVFTPIEAWTSDDVWMFLMQFKNPWGYNNKDLLSMYAGASADGECPLVIDTSTPSCGDSRFGCWVCTLVEKDKSMAAMIQNDYEKEWMLPLLELRNALDFRNRQGEEDGSDRHLRDFRRMNGNVQLFHGRPIPGPYKQKSREMWLRKLLNAQTWIRKNGPEAVHEIELITLAELQEIRLIWVLEKHEFEDSLPQIYYEEVGTRFPGPRLDENLLLGADDLEVLREVCGDNAMHFELMRELLSLAQRQQRERRRHGIYDELEKALARHYYRDEEDAISFAQLKATSPTESSESDRLLVRETIQNESPLF
jgi:DNA sulfur modification protein DndC